MGLLQVLHCKILLQYTEPQWLFIPHWFCISDPYVCGVWPQLSLKANSMGSEEKIKDRMVISTAMLPLLQCATSIAYPSLQTQRWKVHTYTHMHKHAHKCLLLLHYSFTISTHLPWGVQQRRLLCFTGQSSISSDWKAIHHYSSPDLLPDCILIYSRSIPEQRHNIHFNFRLSNI